MKPQRDLGANLLKIVLKTKNKKAPANHASALMCSFGIAKSKFLLQTGTDQ